MPGPRIKDRPRRHFAILRSFRRGPGAFVSFCTSRVRRSGKAPDPPDVSAAWLSAFASVPHLFPLPVWCAISR